ncbi:hypothetical protein [Nakamurella leprariae]|uniref:Uncharacterized protein n=1 Tax=Nakamurella leprariae TaxID=2803911 RepID=A0A938YE61_9ACTN|nr:hypothetical protein [Nakamurella leprariae]MBM9466529.1 hypothetical protein [Nakamurella leprariae]
MDAGGDPVLARLARAVEEGAGHRAATRRELERLWQDLGGSGPPLHRCAVAHAMADVQDDPERELVWDRRALAAAEQVTPDEAERAGLSVAGLLPSLHLNLGDVHRRLGNAHAARQHTELGLVAAHALGDDGYGRMISAALHRLAARLDVPP